MKRIMVATDFSTRSDRAVRRAVLIAHAIAAELILVHVVDDDQPPHLMERQRVAAEELLGQMAETLSVVDRIESQPVVTTGDAFDGILRAAVDVDPDLIVIGSHRRTFLDTFVGTTAERTIRRSRHPVLMANAVPSRRHHRALLAIDFDESTRHAIASAERLRLFESVDLIALHLFAAPAAGFMKRAMEPTEAIAHYVSREEKRARANLASFLAEGGAPRAGLRLDPLQGSAAASIRDHADAERADLIVLGTNQRTGLERLFLGSVAKDVLLAATQDVLVVPSERGDGPRDVMDGASAVDA